MANPVFVNIPEGAWKKVATNIVAGTIHKIYVAPSKYLQTFKLTGGAAPTLISEGATMFENSGAETISNSLAIDVYVWAFGAAGRVRVDV